MKKMSGLLLIIGALAVSSAFAQETSVLERARNGVKKGTDATVSVIKKGADATARGFKHAGEWVEKKTGTHPPKNTPQPSPPGG